MSTARRYLPQYTLADYRHWEGDWELWEGIPIAMTPSPFGGHAQAVARCITCLQLAVEHSACDASVLTELDWIVSDTTILRPDIVVSCGPAPAEHLRAVPAIVVEVLSPSTANRDLGEKKQLYGDLGVEHYLCVDPAGPTIRRFQLDRVGQYRESLAEGRISARICDVCELQIDLSRVLAIPEN